MNGGCVVETDPNADISGRRRLRERGKPREGQATTGFLPNAAGDVRRWCGDNEGNEREEARSIILGEKPKASACIYTHELARACMPRTRVLCHTGHHFFQGSARAARSWATIRLGRAIVVPLHDITNTTQPRMDAATLSCDTLDVAALRCAVWHNECSGAASLYPR